MSAHRIVLHVADVISAAAIAGAMMQWLPPFAALGGVLWYGIQIWESKTVQKWVRVYRVRGRLARIKEPDSGSVQDHTG